MPDVNGPKDVVGVMIRVETINSLVSLFWSPLMGGICDSFGRRRLLVVLPAFSAAARHLLVATFPSRKKLHCIPNRERGGSGFRSFRQ